MADRTNPERLRELAEKATPGPWGWNSYSRIDSVPACERYNEAEALIPSDADEDDPRWAALPEYAVAYVPPSGHGDLPTAAGARDADYIAAASPDVILALLDRADRAEARVAALTEAAKAVIANAEPDDNFEGEFIDFLVPFEQIDALRLATTPPPHTEASEPA